MAINHTSAKFGTNQNIVNYSIAVRVNTDDVPPTELNVTVPENTPTSDRRSSELNETVWLVSVAVMFVLIAGVLVIIYRRRRQKRRSQSEYGPLLSTKSTEDNPV